MNRDIFIFISGVYLSVSIGFLLAAWWVARHKPEPEPEPIPVITPADLFANFRVVSDGGIPSSVSIDMTPEAERFLQMLMRED